MGNIDITKILPNPEQPRKVFDEAELEGLAESIRENGIIQPLIVEWADAGLYILHDGERRLRAARLAGLTEVPASIVPPLNGTGKTDRLVRALVANIQRADLGPIEEGKSYARLRDETGMGANQIAIRLGISCARVSHRLQLLELETDIQDLIESGRLTKDKRLVDALQSIPDTAARVALATRLAERRATTKAGVEACEKLKHHLQAEKFSRDDVPAARMAVRRAGEVDHPRWDALAQLGKMPPWILMEISVRDTCKACSLYEMASVTTCKECPMVSLLATMIGQVKK